jgi:hypothetical protein
MGVMVKFMVTVLSTALFYTSFKEVISYNLLGGTEAQFWFLGTSLSFFLIITVQVDHKV